MGKKELEMGERIKAAREAEGLTQAQIGRELEVTRTAVGAWEKGQYMPERKHWSKLADILKITLAYLVAGKGTRPPERTDKDKRFVRLTNLHLRNMILQGRFDEHVYLRVAALLEADALDDLLRKYGYRKEGEQGSRD
jgi:transcriptional regulator with XRE-family HTH domain